jgi:hypothetical protein
MHVHFSHFRLITAPSKMSSRKKHKRGLFGCTDSDGGEEESQEKTMDPRKTLSSASEYVSFPQEWDSCAC